MFHFTSTSPQQQFYTPRTRNPFHSSTFPSVTPTASYRHQNQLPSYPTSYPTSNDDFDYDSYDASRSAQELRTLALKQQQRRDAEEVAIRRQAAHQAEQDRLELEAYRAAARRVAAEQEAEERRQRQLAAAFVAARREAAIALAIEKEQEERRRAYERAIRRRHAVAEAEAQAQAQARARVQQQRCIAHHRQQLAAQQSQEHQQQSFEEGLHDFASFFQHLLEAASAAGAPEPSASTLAPESSASAVPPASSESESSPPAAPTAVASSSSTPASADVEPTYHIVFQLVGDDSSPASTSAAPASKATPSAEEAEAAEAQQRKYRAQLLRRHQLASLSALSTSLDARQSTFTLPETLVLADSSTAEEPKLAYTPSNAPFASYEEFLVGLLSKVDAVQSAGDRLVKLARKELVQRVETELRVLDGKKADSWRALKGKAKDFETPEAELSAAPFVVPNTVETPDAVTEDAPSLESDSTTSADKDVPTESSALSPTADVEPTGSTIDDSVPAVNDETAAAETAEVVEAFAPVSSTVNQPTSPGVDVPTTFSSEPSIEVATASPTSTDQSPTAADEGTQGVDSVEASSDAESYASEQVEKGDGDDFVVV